MFPGERTWARRPQLLDVETEEKRAKTGEGYV